MGWIKNASGKMFDPGQELLDVGAVIRARTDHNVLWARIRDKTVHAVCVHLDPQMDMHQCTCPSSEAVCQHVVAALLYASKNLPEMICYECNFGLMIDHLLEGTSDEELRDLVAQKINDCEVLDYDPTEKETISAAVQKIKDDIKKVDDLTRQEMIHLAVRRMAYDTGAFFKILHIMGRNEFEARTDCSSNIEKMFVKLHQETYDTMVWSSPNLNFNKFFQRVRKYVRKENYHRAACIYQGISEAIADNMDLIDDSNEYYAKKVPKSHQGHVRNRQPCGSGPPTEAPVHIVSARDVYSK